MATAKKAAPKKGGTAAGAPLGSGKNFAKVAAEAGGGKKGAAIAAIVGRKKYGNDKMSKMAAKGRSRAAKGK